MKRLDPIFQIPDLWAGWYAVGDFLLDDAGNHYSIWEIRALRYIIGENVQLRRLLTIVCPPKTRKPEQLTLPFPPMWRHQYEFLKRKSDNS